MVARILVAENGVDEKIFLKDEGLSGKNVWSLEVPENGVKISDLKKWLKTNYLSTKAKELMIFWINGADNLSEQCQNVLLKPLEEAREEVLFVLTVKNESGLLPTILSRCDVRPVKQMGLRLRRGSDEAKWEDLIEAWKLGSGASMALLDKWEKDKEIETLNFFIKRLAKGLRGFPSARRVKILQLALELKKDSRLMVNKKLLLGRFLLEGCKISGLASSS
jgi:hypothetical protein